MTMKDISAIIPAVATTTARSVASLWLIQIANDPPMVVSASPPQLCFPIYSLEGYSIIDVRATIIALLSSSCRRHTVAIILTIQVTSLLVVLALFTYPEQVALK